MNRMQARTMAERIQGTWGARWSDHQLDAWIEELEPHDDGQVTAVIRRLRRTLDKAPTIAQFLAELGATTQDRYEPNHCTTCSGNGWIDAGTETRRYPSGTVLTGPVVRRCPACRGKRRPQEPPPEFLDA